LDKSVKGPGGLSLLSVHEVAETSDYGDTTCDLADHATET
jgi:hypothetical protein